MDRSHWPKHVKALELDGLNYLGRDASNRLYWDGKPIPISLNKYEKILAAFVTTAVVAGAIGSTAQGWAAYHDWACKNNWWTVTCPSPTKNQDDEANPRFRFIPAHNLPA